ncbi:hypothetical protein [Isoptericola sp. NPDC057191]|uniref:hypothetical protein n=1 Tax=Isoptericola sp. NPDC057191 TaxID=3346041 RepID=UPI003640182D
MLGRAASGLGALQCRVVSSEAAQVAVAYEARGVQGVLAPGQTGHGPDPAHPRVSRWDDRISIDLGHVDELTRFAVMVRSTGGTLVTTTATDARIDVELGGEGLDLALTGHVVHGCLVLRAEGRTLSGSLRDATTAYGYDDVAWAAPDTPLPPHHTHPHEGISR